MTGNLYGIMIKYPEPGKVKTRLAKDIGDEKATEVYRRLAEKVMKNTGRSFSCSPLSDQSPNKTPSTVIPAPDYDIRGQAPAGIQSPQDVLDCPIKSGNDNEGGFANDLPSNKRPPLAISPNPSFPKRGISDISLGAQYCATIYERIVFCDPPERLSDFEAWFPGERLLVQRGSDVGERMDNLIRDLLATGAEKAVITGADIPDLTSLIIMAAFAALDHADIVIGPAKDGGYYLIGMKAPHPEIFQDIQWSTGSVFEETMRRIKRLRLTCASITTLSDLDTVEDYNNL